MVIRVLLIQPWTSDLAPIRDALSDLSVEVTRIDLEPALHASLARAPIDLVIYDPATTGLPLDTVTRCLRTHGREAPVIVMQHTDSLHDQVMQALSLRRT